MVGTNSIIKFPFLTTSEKFPLGLEDNTKTKNIYGKDALGNAKRS